MDHFWDSKMLNSLSDTHNGRVNSFTVINPIRIIFWSDTLTHTHALWRLSWLTSFAFEPKRSLASFWTRETLARTHLRTSWRKARILNSDWLSLARSRTRTLTPTLRSCKNLYNLYTLKKTQISANKINSNNQINFCLLLFTFIQDQRNPRIPWDGCPKLFQTVPKLWDNIILQSQGRQAKSVPSPNCLWDLCPGTRDPWDPWPIAIPD